MDGAMQGYYYQKCNFHSVKIWIEIFLCFKKPIILQTPARLEDWPLLSAALFLSLCQNNSNGLLNQKRAF